MVHGDQRHVQRRGAGLGEVYADEYRPDQARRVGDGHGVDILFFDPGSLDGALRQDRDGLYMAAGRDLRHDAAIDRMQGRLGEDLIGQYLPAVLHDGDGSLVTG